MDCNDQIESRPPGRYAGVASALLGAVWLEFLMGARYDVRTYAMACQYVSKTAADADACSWEQAAYREVFGVIWRPFRNERIHESQPSGSRRYKNRYHPRGQRTKLCHVTHLAKELLLQVEDDSVLPRHPIRVLADYIDVSERTAGSAMRMLKDSGLVREINDNEGEKAYVLMVGDYPLCEIYAKVAEVAGINWINYEKGQRWKRDDPNGRNRIFENVREHMPSQTIADELRAVNRTPKRAKACTAVGEEAVTVAAATGTDGAPTPAPPTGTPATETGTVTESANAKIESGPETGQVQPTRTVSRTDREPGRRTGKINYDERPGARRRR